MRRTLPILTALLVLGSQVGERPFLGPHDHLHAQEQLAPVSYVCPMHGDVVDVVPGSCPVCKMDLEAVRLDLAWSCPNHAAVITGKPGTCPVDRRELVQVTVAKYWTCPETGRTHLLEPGLCANRTPRTLEQAIREHGDHNPRHGGQFFMAADKWHHLEGTYPRTGVFRMHFYDNFTKAIAAKGFSGRLVTREEGMRELAAVPLRPSRDGQTLEADLKGLATPAPGAPLKVTAKVVLKPGEPEQRFDFTFTDLSKEPFVAPAPAKATAVRSAGPPPKRAAAPAPAPAPAAAPAPAPAPASAPASTMATAATAAAPSATATAPGAVEAAAAPDRPAADAAATPAPDGPPQLADCRPTMSRNDAVAFGQRLPRASGELLRLLSLCSAEVDTLIKQGQLGLVYQPSILSKDIAIALEDTTAELPNRMKAPASDAIRRVVLAAWMLDLYGDQGNMEKLAESFTTFAAAVADIKTAYGVTP